MKVLSYKNLYKAHIYIGIFVSFHFLVLSVTGAILLLQNKGPQGSEFVAVSQSPTGSHSRYDSILKDAIRQFPSDRPLALFVDENHDDLVQVRLGKNGLNQLKGARKLVYDAVSGQILRSKNLNSGFFHFILQLHREVLLGGIGKLYVGFIGILFIFTLISGLVVYGSFMRGRFYSEIRTRQLSKSYSDFHKFIGVTVFSWALLMGLTGVVLAFNSTLFKFYQLQELSSLKNKYSQLASLQSKSYASLDLIVSSLNRAIPNSKVSYIAFPGTEYSVPNHFLILVKGIGGFKEKMNELVVVDAYSGALVEHLQLPLYLKAFMLSEPLHFGNYAGPVLKVIWGLFSVCSMFLALTGIVSFILKRNKKYSHEVRKQKNIKLIVSHQLIRQSPYYIPLGISVLILAGVFLGLSTTGILHWIAYFSLSISIFIIFSVVVLYLWNVRNYEKRTFPDVRKI